MTPPTGSLGLWDAYTLSGLTLEQLWLNYVSVGGGKDPGTVARSLRDPDQLTDLEHDLIAQAINEHFIDHDQDHPAAYRHDGSTPTARKSEITAENE